MAASGQSFISIISYNVLCDAYIRPEFYPKCDPSAFLPERRHPLLLDRIAAFYTDVICLQEVDAAMFDRVQKRLQPQQYVGHWAKKGAGKPDGCATFVRLPLEGKRRGLLVAGYDVHSYEDGDGTRAASGHLLQNTMVVTPEGRAVMVINTHLKWDPPAAPSEKRVGLAQARQLAAMPASPTATIICGDFNAEHGSDVMKALAEKGYQDAHLTAMEPTCMPDGELKKIDAILCNDRLLVHDFGTTPLCPQAPPPSTDEPSDHVPIGATLVTVAY